MLAAALHVRAEALALNIMATTFTLGDGNTMPAIGLGTFQIPDADVDEPVATALKLGYKHIDTARIYANEAGVGRSSSPRPASLASQSSSQVS